MKPEYIFFVLVLVVLAFGALVMLGETEQNVSLSGVMELAGDAHRTALKPAMVATRVSAAQEQELGDKLARRMFFRACNEDCDECISKKQYIDSVARPLLDYIERDEIQYTFHLIESSMVNAFALPGGHIFVFTGLLDFVESEAELAVVLGHEIMHVDARHCIEMFQAQMAVDKILNPIAVEASLLSRIAMTYANRIITGGYRKYQEFEADLGGLTLAAMAGYDPSVAENLMLRLEKKFSDDTDKKNKALDPLKEVTQAIAQAVGSYYDSHPPTAERVDRMRTLARRLKRKDKQYYIGKKNLEILQSRREKEINGEFAR